jgi:hypothetical protein
MAVSRATQIWAYRQGLVPFGHLAVGEEFTHPATPGTVYVKSSGNGWYHEKANPKAKWRGNAGTAVKRVATP